MAVPLAGDMLQALVLATCVPGGDDTGGVASIRGLHLQRNKGLCPIIEW